jgi:2-methylcitrate dehydratase PrpD
VTAPLARRLAEAVAPLGEAALEPAVAARATALLRDFIGVALGGAGADSSGAVRRGLGRLGLRGDGTVLGCAERLPAPQAALANGAAAHALEMDDTHRGGSIHLGAAVFPAVLAAAELCGARGARVLGAAVGGYEVAARLAMALGPAAHYRRGFHPTGTCGAFGAAAAAGIVLGLDAERLAHALGIAGSQAAGSMEFLADGTWTKRLHAGWAACAGLHAAALAGAGFRAPATILEGRFGVLHAYTDAGTPAPLDGPVPGPGGFELCQTSVKPHACCRYAQGPIDATLALRTRHAIRPEAVERVEVGVLGAAVDIVCEPAAAKRRPANVVDAQFSLPFAVAVALARGAASPAEYAPAVWQDPVVERLMDRVVAVHDTALDARYPRAWPCWVRIALADGRTVTAELEAPLGDPENFPDAAALDAKFRTLAGRALSAAALTRLGREVDALADAVGVEPLLAATRPSA